MEIDILDSLDELGYDKKLKDVDITTAVKEGVKNANFTELVSWFSKELQVLCALEDSVNSIKDPEDANSFMLELSSFLKEINCPHKTLMEGPVSQRLINDNQRIVLLDFLCTELQAARILSKKIEKRDYMEIEMDESKTAQYLKETLSFLGLDVPKEEISADEILTNIENRVKMLTSMDPENAPLLIGAGPLLTDTLTESQWSALKAFQEEMHNEYYLRRQMLLKRLDVTIQSFKWGDELKKKEDKIMECYLPIRKTLTVEPSVQLSDVLAARTSSVIIEKTSSSQVQTTHNEMYKHVMGNVPDRGGRPREMYPAKEMPSWKKRSGDPFSGGTGRGGGRGTWSNRGKKRFDTGDRGRNRKQAFDAAGSYGN